MVAKAPVPGRVKTRLCPPLTADEAADVALAALVDTIAAADASGADERVIALDGVPGAWVPSGWRIVPQRGVTLSDRLAAAWADAGAPAVQIGMDTPQLSGDILNEAMSGVLEHGCALGPATDGGWWSLGLRMVVEGAFEGVPMSRSDTRQRQVARLQSLGWPPHILSEMTDVDTWADAETVAHAAPKTQFAESVSAIRRRWLDRA